MRWISPRRQRTQPSNGKYVDWKNEIAADCSNRCVYCAITESLYGGLDNFHVEHFRPKSLFQALINDINNLYLACAICNRFKRDAWPCEPLADNSHAGFPDPAVHDFSTVFTLDSLSFEASSQSAAGKFAIARLYLNRPQLLRERRSFALGEKMAELRDYLDGAVDLLMVESSDPEAVALMRDAIKLLINISEYERQHLDERPYEPHEIRRPKKKPLKRKAAKGSRKARRRSDGDT
jgi:hypothetical protein